MQVELQNAFVSNLNERNLLVRKEEHIQLLLQVKDKEADYEAVQAQLRHLVAIDDAERTEAEKAAINRLMEELIAIVNTKDQLVTQILDNEKGSLTSSFHQLHLHMPRRGAGRRRTRVCPTKSSRVSPGRRSAG